MHVLIDLDGTISDSSPGIAGSLRHAFTSCGYEPPTEAAVRTVIGPPLELGLPMLGVAAADLGRVIGAYRAHYEAGGLFDNELYPGVVDMLDELAAAGYALSVATAKPEPTAVRIIEHFGLTDRFDVIAGASTEPGRGTRTKADVIADALARLGICAAHPAGRPVRSTHPGVVMVGDRDHDVIGAAHSGLPCVGVTWGFGSAEELRTAGAAVIVDTPGRVAAAVAATYRAVRP